MEHQPVGRMHEYDLLRDEHDTAEMWQSASVHSQAAVVA
jgi:hypothetical protein